MLTHANLIQQGLGAGGSLIVGNTLQLQGQHDVLKRADDRDQVEALKDHTDLMQSQCGQRMVVQLSDILTIEPQRARRRAVDGGKHVE